VTLGQPSLSRGQVPKRNEHTEIVNEVLCLIVEWVTQKVAQISPRKLRLEWSLRESEFELKRVFQRVCKLNWVAKRATEAWGAFYSPQGNLPVGGVRDLDKSRLGFEHVRQHSLESSLDTRHVRCLGLTWVMADRLDMSRLGAEHVRFRFLKSGYKPGFVRYSWELWYGDSFWWFALQQLIQCTPLIVRNS
jgi:hypothetical protein